MQGIINKPAKPLCTLLCESVTRGDAYGNVSTQIHSWWTSQHVLGTLDMSDKHATHGARFVRRHSWCEWCTANADLLHARERVIDALKPLGPHWRMKIGVTSRIQSGPRRWKGCQGKERVGPIRILMKESLTVLNRNLWTYWDTSIPKLCKVHTESELCESTVLHDDTHLNLCIREDTYFSWVIVKNMSYIMMPRKAYNHSTFFCCRQSYQFCTRLRIASLCIQINLEIL